MKEKIWYEMVEMKYGETYLSKYLTLQRTLKKSFKILTLLLSVSGILGWKFFEEYAWVAFILIAVMQLFTLIENELITSDQDIEDISELKMLYTKYFHKLEELWAGFRIEIIPEEDASKKFFKFRKKYWEKIEHIDCKLNIKKYKYLMDKTDTETNNYINKYHNHE